MKKGETVHHSFLLNTAVFVSPLTEKIKLRRTLWCSSQKDRTSFVRRKKLVEGTNRSSFLKNMPHFVPSPLIFKKTKERERENNEVLVFGIKDKGKKRARQGHVRSYEHLQHRLARKLRNKSGRQGRFRLRKTSTVSSAGKKELVEGTILLSFLKKTQTDSFPL